MRLLGKGSGWQTGQLFQPVDAPAPGRHCLATRIQPHPEFRPMARDSSIVDDEILTYIRKVGVRDDADLEKLRAETAAHPRGIMQISPEQGAFMSMLLKLIGAQRIFEVGVFTGYSAMVAAKAMGPKGRVVGLDISKEFTDIARRHWQSAGVADRIDLRLGPAVDSLKAMVAAGETGAYDFAFIDADKGNYDNYYELALTLVKPGGLIAIDNVLWHRKAMDMTVNDADTLAVRAINEKVIADKRVDACMVSIGDGITLAKKL